MICENTFIQGLITFLNNSPTPFHAVQSMKAILALHGFTELKEDQTWAIKKGEGYYVSRNDSALIAFIAGFNDLNATGFRIIGAHTDSPCLKIKPEGMSQYKSYSQLNVEVYGGVLLNTWFDRDLSLAGRLSFVSQDQKIYSSLIDFKRPVAVIPSLAIHLDKEANKNRTINAQNDLPPILGQLTQQEELSFITVLKNECQNNMPMIDDILSFEIELYDTQPAAITGLTKSFLTGHRLDNLISCYAGIQSLIQGNRQYSSMVVCNDHEEVGSTSSSGAYGNFLESVFKRVCIHSESFFRTIARSFLISSDNAHGVHPNYIKRFDTAHGPILNQGPVIKVNTNQRYASNSQTIAMFKYLCQKSGITAQPFVMRSDMACGSTIGPITASRMGIKTIDIGVPTFAMHSIRETAGVKDCYALYLVLRTFVTTGDLHLI